MEPRRFSDFSLGFPCRVYILMGWGEKGQRASMRRAWWKGRRNRGTDAKIIASQSQEDFLEHLIPRFSNVLLSAVSSFLFLFFCKKSYIQVSVYKSEESRSATIETQVRELTSFYSLGSAGYNWKAICHVSRMPLKMGKLKPLQGHWHDKGHTVVDIQTCAPCHSG